MASNRDKKMQEITERLQKGMEELFQSEQYTQYLKVMSQFHRYSFNNTLLIAMQRPGATLVAGYSAREKKFNRNVMKGEKGIRIISLAPSKEKKEQKKIDPETGEVVLREDGQPETEEVTITIPRFKVATVFDVSQTDGDPLPELGIAELTASVDNYDLFMEAIDEITPVPIRYEDISGTAKGYFDPINKERVIRQGMGELQTVKTAIHETVHALLHDRDVMKAQGILKDQLTRECEAESVAYTVLSYFGLDTSEYSFPYIASWSSGKDMKELRSSMDTIRKTAGEMIDGIESGVRQRILERKEMFQTIDLFGTPALFSDSRVDRSLLPEGIYCYELRGADYDPGMPISLEEYVRINHAGTILTAFEVKLPEERHVWLGDGLNFMEGEQNLEEYRHTVENRNAEVLAERMQSEIGRANEMLYLSGAQDRYILYQISGTSKGYEYLFRESSLAKDHGQSIEAQDYVYGYSGLLQEGETLESFESRINRVTNIRNDTGNNLLVSDVLVMARDGENKAYYVDEQGWTELPDFVEQRKRVVELTDKMWYAPVTMNSTGVEVEQHEGLWHPVERRIVQDEIFYLMQHNEYGNSVNGVMVDSDGTLIAQELEYGFDRGALKAVQEYFSERGKSWEPTKEELKLWGMEEREYLPLYRQTIEFAMQHGEVDAFLESRSTNIACKNAVEEAIRTHFDGMHLDEKAVSSVLRAYGGERLSFVLACTLQEKSRDGRFSEDNKKWAASKEIPENIYRGRDGNLDYVIESHPAVLDGFTRLARERIDEQDRAFIKRYYVVNDTYGINEEPKYQYYEDLNEALSVYHRLPNHLDKSFCMESAEKIPSRMTLISCRNGVEELEDIEVASLSGKWIKSDVAAAARKAQFYLDNKDSEIAYKLLNQKGYFLIQTTAEGYYDYTFYDSFYREQDGGTLDNDECSIREAMVEILGENNLNLSQCKVIDLDDFLNQVERVESRELQEKVKTYSTDTQTMKGKASYQQENSKERAEPEISVQYYVAECMEFPVLGEYHEVVTLQEARDLYEQIPAERMHGIKGIGIQLYEGSEWLGDYPILTAGKVDTEMIGLADHYRNSPAVRNMLEEIARQYPESKEIQPVKGEEGKIEPEKVDGPGSGSKKESVLKALRERQAKIKEREKCSLEQKKQERRKGDLML